MLVCTCRWQPLRERVRVLEVDKSVWDEEQSRLEREVRDVNARLASVLARHNTADPEEHRLALQKVCTPAMCTDVKPSCCIMDTHHPEFS